MPRVVKPTSTAPTDMSVSWETVSDTFSRSSVIMRIYGGTGTGRSSLAFSAPGPQAIFDCSELQEGVIEPYAATKEMRKLQFFVSTMGKSSVQVAAECRAMLQKIMAHMDDAYSWARSLVVDTDYDLWQLTQLATLGSFAYNEKLKVKTEKGKELGQLAYAEINADWYSMLKAPHLPGRNSNLILIGTESPDYKTGKIKADGQKFTKRMSNVQIHTSRKLDGTFRAKIEKAWMNPSMVGEVFEDEPGTPIEDRMISFPMIMSLITDTDVDLWS